MDECPSSSVPSTVLEVEELGCMDPDGFFGVTWSLGGLHPFQHAALFFDRARV